ncbi:hypothetical protein [Leptolyngbya sp. 7M]|uniref:hypothetical protein n=1 Tax=Leptolyngbya sp. 7M TaxID=2812896 RepID=UPI001B8C1E24|nr:hypothetical protein [Leptolyngbya sp. 7M]QYO63122.1 hypothetical protein JVX88_24620 [Leptolyngbya sp. 7M]
MDIHPSTHPPIHLFRNTSILIGRFAGVSQSKSAEGQISGQENMAEDFWQTVRKPIGNFSGGSQVELGLPIYDGS